MTQDTRPDAFDTSTRTLLTIQAKGGGTKKQYKITTISTDKSGGTKDFDVISNYADGFIKKHSDRTPIELTLEGYAVEVGRPTETEGTGYDGLMNTATEVSGLTTAELDNDRTEYILVFEKTTDTTATDAMAASIVGARAIRYQFKNGNFTDVAFNDTDGKILKYTVKFKTAPADIDGNENFKMESTDGTASTVLPEVTYA